MKRESKAYKFKEQMAELELRRELEAKKRQQEGYTLEQKKAMEEQLKKESAIRKQVLSVIL